MKLLVAVLLAVVLLSSAAAPSAPAAAGLLNGRWVGPGGRMRTAKPRRSGVEVGRQFAERNGESGFAASRMAKASFDPKSSAIHMELIFRAGRRNRSLHIDGKADPKTMRGTWTRNNGKGDFSLTKE